MNETGTPAQPITSIENAQSPSSDATDSEKPRSRNVTRLIEGLILFLALLLGLAIRWGVYESALVVSRSMQPTLQVNDRLLIDHRVALRGNWRRGDIVLFNAPQSWSDDSTLEGEKDYLIKRVIGMPGEKILVYRGRVWINDAPLQEPYLDKTPDNQTDATGGVLAAGEYFVMGDNRANSDDSRTYGPITDDDIIGRAVRILGPFSRMSGLPSPQYE